MNAINMTYTGKFFDLFNPTPEMICLEDIAHHLACTNRYGGSTRVPYSVAEHCVRMSYLTVGNPIVNLLHDSAEAYINDIISPQKGGLGWRFGGYFQSYREIEALILLIIGESLGIKDLQFKVKNRETKVADLTMLATEVRDLMPEGALNHPIFKEWIQSIEPDSQRIHPWAWDIAKAEYIGRFKELTSGKS